MVKILKNASFGHFFFKFLIRNNYLNFQQKSALRSLNEQMSAVFVSLLRHFSVELVDPGFLHD